MRLLGKSSREKRQNAGNICLFVFLVFICTVFLAPVQNANAAQTKLFNVPVNEVTFLDDDQVRIQMLLTPATDQNFDFIFLDFKKVFNDKTVVKKVYYDATINGYLVDFVYELSEDQEDVGCGSWVKVLDEDGNKLQHVWIDLKIRPPQHGSD